MKNLKEVESDRKKAHAKPKKNSVHRTSLLVPTIPATEAGFSFLNHFLLKRGITDVVCKVTALNPQGKVVDTTSFPINEPRVYQISIGELFPAVDVNNCIVEFYSATNLFIPFPAVMVNHFGNGFVNSVHAYNRILNDVFENDAINSNINKEASIDVRINDEYDTFLLFATGVQDCKQSLRIELADKKRSLSKEVPVNISRLSHQRLSLKEIFPEFRTAEGEGAVLKVLQPAQFLFYGRVLGGQVNREGAFSANHSYYDCEDHPEYWEDSSPSYRLYPYLPGFQNGVRIYPTAAPGKLRVEFQLHGKDGKVLGKSNPQILTSPSAEFVDFSVNQMLKSSGIQENELSAFRVVATPESGPAPTRIGAQLIYSRGKLEASINFQLFNDNIYFPERDRNIVWGQTILGGGFNTWLGITSSVSKLAAIDIKLTFYSVKGAFTKRDLVLKKDTALTLNLEEELGKALGDLDMSEPHCIWYTMETGGASLVGHTLVSHKDTGHCGGEHSF